MGQKIFSFINGIEVMDLEYLNYILNVKGESIIPTKRIKQIELKNEYTVNNNYIMQGLYTKPIVIGNVLYEGVLYINTNMEVFSMYNSQENHYCKVYIKGENPDLNISFCLKRENYFENCKRDENGILIFS